MWKPTWVVDCRNGKAIFGRVSYSRLLAIHRFRSKIKMIAKSLTQSSTQWAQTYTSTHYFYWKRFSSQSFQHSRHLGNISHKAVSPSRNSSPGPLARPNLSLNRFPVFSVCFSFFFFSGLFYQDFRTSFQDEITTSLMDGRVRCGVFRQSRTLERESFPIPHRTCDHMVSADFLGDWNDLLT